MKHVLFRRCAADQIVVEIHENEIESVADGIHQSLKILRCVLQTKWCPKELGEAECCDDCSLAHVICSYLNLVVGTYQVDLIENRSTRELRGKVLDVWHRIAAGRRDVIEAYVVATRSPTAGVLRHHVQGGRPRTV